MEKSLQIPVPFSDRLNQTCSLQHLQFCNHVLRSLGILFFSILSLNDVYYPKKEETL
jgi:hypothetical protein